MQAYKYEQMVLSDHIAICHSTLIHPCQRFAGNKGSNKNFILPLLC